MSPIHHSVLFPLVGLTTITTIIILALSLFPHPAHAHVQHKSRHRYAVECLSQGPHCIVAPSSCTPGYKVHHQSKSCVRSACQYCISHHMNDTVCSSWDAHYWCAKRTNAVGIGEASARCMSLGSSCGGWIAHRSRHCGYMVPGDKQSVKCKQAACKHCTKVLNDEEMKETHSSECGYKVLQYCENEKELLKEHLPVHHHNFAENCTYVTDDKDRIVIPMTKTPEEAQWTRTSDGLDGLEWRANDSRIWPSVTGRGEYCYHVKFARQGTYFVTAQTRAQGIKQHNDMYMRFSGELEFFHADIMRPFPYFIRARNSYFKVYQNVGADQLTKVLSTVDGIPHILVTKHVKSTRKYHVCVSGRSSKFALYRIFFIRCHKLQCKRTTEFIQDRLVKNTATPCLMD